MKTSSVTFARVSAVALACAALWVRGGAPVGAQSAVTITSPANGAVLAAGPDFATDTLSDPWDFNNREDVAIDPAQLDGFSNFTVSGGLAGGTTSTSRVGANNGSNFYILQRAYYNIVNPGRNGRNTPIEPGIYSKLSFKMTVTRGDQFPRFYWFHNELGNPAGDASGFRFVDPNTPSPSGAGIYTVDMTQGNNGTPWTAGPVKGFAFYPNSSAVGYDVKVDWVRLTTGDGHAASKIVPVSWSGGSGTATIQVRDAAGTVFTVASGISGTTFNWNYGVLPPGTYTLTVVRGGVTSAATTFRVNTPPTVQVLDPDESGGQDFATTVLGNAWDMLDSADVKFDGGATIVDHLIARSFSGGLFHGTSDTVGDPQVYVLSNPSAGNTTATIDTTRFHRLTYSLQIDHGFDLAGGSMMRVMWGANTGPGAPYTGLGITKDILAWPGMNTYSIDLATLSGALEGGLLPENPLPWTAARMRHLRIDPFELQGNVNFHLGAVKLAADDETTNGSFTIRWSGTDADGDPATIDLYYDTDRNPGSGLVPIVLKLPLSSGQVVWNAGSVPQGTYYIYAVAGDGRNAVGRYSTGPVRVSGFVGGGSNPRMSVDSPQDGSSGGASVTIAGWAADLGASSGTGINQVHVYADPGTARETYLGAAALGGARGDIAAIFGAQFANSGFSLTTPSLSGGPHVIGVYAHSTVSNANTVRTVSYAVNTVGAALVIDEPGAGSVCQQPCAMSGWAIDGAAPSGTGVDAVHVYALPIGGGGPLFVGIAQYGSTRSDVGGTFGSRFTSSGYRLTIRGLPPGGYQLYAYGHSLATNSFSLVTNKPITARNSPRLSIDTPGNGQIVTGASFPVGGWAIDLASASGPGVDAVHVYAFPAGSSSPILLGIATYGASRPDVGSAYGSTQFNASGYNLRVTGLAPGAYDIYVYAHSRVSGAFDNVAGVRVNVR